MKHIMTWSVLSLLSLSAFANNVAVKCDLSINENTVKCPLVGFCPEKTLRESSLSVSQVLNEGQVIDHSLTLNKVVLYPGTKKQDRHSVYLLPGDERATKLRDEKDTDLVSFESSTKVNINMQSVGDTVHVILASGGSNYRFRMQGNFTGKLTGWVYADIVNEKGNPAKLPIYATCSKMNALAISESELQKEAIERHLREKKEQEGSAVQQ